jgi:hypothetical protein
VKSRGRTCTKDDAHGGRGVSIRSLAQEGATLLRAYTFSLAPSFRRSTATFLPHDNTGVVSARSVRLSVYMEDT